MHPVELRSAARALHGDGLSFSAIGRELDVHKDTVRYWLREAKPRETHGPCPRCWEPLPSPVRAGPSLYAFLLLAYLGDGSIVRVQPHKRSLRLTITLDDRYEQLQEAVLLATDMTFPGSNARLVKRRSSNCSDVLVHHTHLACVFPQHGPGGPKHERPIALEPWQWDIVERHPWEALRGAIYTDGCSYENRLTIKGRDYAYTTFDFTNRSEDIHAIVAQIAVGAGLQPRRNGKSLRFARRADVAQLLARVGRKDEVPIDLLREQWTSECPGWDSNPH